MAQMEVVVALCLPSGGFALSLLLGKFSADVDVWFWGWSSLLGRNEGHHWLKQQNPFLWDWMCCWGVWHGEIMAINTEPAWHGTELLLA